MDIGFYKKYFDIEKRHWLMRVRRMIVEDALARYCKPPESTKLLDFGCGSGYFVGELAKKGYEAHGLDMSEEAVDFGALEGIRNLKVMRGKRINADDATFDAALAMDVLEHLEDETWAVQELFRVLKPGGILIITVPAYKWMWGVQDEVSHHFRRYTRGMLRARAGKAMPWTEERMSYFNTFLFIPIVLVRLASKLMKSKRQSDFDINSEFLNKIFYAIFAAERRLLKYVNYPFGVSILAVLRKPG